jgi:hypothetical protein
MKQSLMLCILLAGRVFSQDLPDPKLTPGAVIASENPCDKAFRTGAVRNVPKAERKKVYAEYGVDMKTSRFYEVDHLCSLEIGGSNDLKNLWPEPWHLNCGGVDKGAKVKDVLENKLHELVCAGKLSLADAQAAICGNWETAYLKYVGPFPAYKGKGKMSDIHWRE